MKMRGKIMTHPTTWIGWHAKALPMAKVAVIKAVLGKTNEYQPMENTNRPGPITDKWAKLAMKKKKIASLESVSATV